MSIEKTEKIEKLLENILDLYPRRIDLRTVAYSAEYKDLKNIPLVGDMPTTVINFADTKLSELGHGGQLNFHYLGEDQITSKITENNKKLNVETNEVDISNNLTVGGEINVKKLGVSVFSVDQDGNVEVSGNLTANKLISEYSISAVDSLDVGNNLTVAHKITSENIDNAKNITTESIDSSTIRNTGDISTSNLTSTNLINSKEINNSASITSPILTSTSKIYSNIINNADRVSSPYIDCFGYDENDVKYGQLNAYDINCDTNIDTRTLNCEENAKFHANVVIDKNLQAKTIKDVVSIAAGTIAADTNLSSNYCEIYETLTTKNIENSNLITSPTITSTTKINSKDIENSNLITSPYINCHNSAKNAGLLNSYNVENINLIKSPYITSTVKINSKDITNTSNIDTETLHSSKNITTDATLKSKNISNDEGISTKNLYSSVKITSKDIENSNSITSPYITSSTKITSKDIENSNLITSPTITSTTKINSKDIENSNSITSPYITSTKEINSVKIINSDVITSPTITSTTKINSKDISNSNSITSPYITSSTKITSKDISNSNDINTKNLYATNLVQSPYITSTTKINSKDISNSNSITSPYITSSTKITSKDIENSNLITSPYITSTVKINSKDISNSNNISTKSLDSSTYVNADTVKATTSVTSPNFYGNASSASVVIGSAAVGSTYDLVKGSMAANDTMAITIGGQTTDDGYLEISTGDNGTEPIYLRQYTSSSILNEATLLGKNGTTKFPVSVESPTFIGSLNGNAATASNYSSGGTIDTGINSKLPLSGGTMTGDILFKQNTGISNYHNNTGLWIHGGRQVGLGASLHLYGFQSVPKGSWEIRATDCNTSKEKILYGKPDGSLTWNGNGVNLTLLDTSNNSTFPGTVTAPTFNGNATSANWADLAEKYESDKNYPMGTLIQFGGEKEITIANTEVNGVISEKPGYLLNASADGLPVALCGKVKVLVSGKVNKFDRISLHKNGVGIVSNNNPIARALESKDSEEVGLVLCVTNFRL